MVGAAFFDERWAGFAEKVIQKPLSKLWKGDEINNFEWGFSG